MPTILAKEKVRRMCLMFSILSNQLKPTSKEKIIDRLYDITGNEYSESTIEKTFFDLRMDFDIVIRYNRSEKGYYIDDEEQEESNQYVFISRLFEYLKLEELKIVKECLTLMSKEQ
jgi:hypothetical protein